MGKARDGFDRVALAFLGVGVVVLAAVNLPHLNGFIGPDYSYFLPRLLGDYEWFRANGYASIPWFTPAFCGGTSDWANPQSMPYSLIQWLVFFVDPVRALQIAFVIYAAAGASGMWLLLRRGFGTSSPAALVGAVLFLFNGFFICRMLVGNPQFGVFMLFPWVSWLLMRGRLDAVIGGAMMGAMLHAGAVAILPALGLAWIAVALLGDFRGFTSRFAMAIGVALSVSVGKMVAMAALATQFPRDQYPLPGYRTIAGFAESLGRALFWRAAPDKPGDVLTAFTIKGFQEHEFSLSPVPLLVLMAFAVLRPRSAIEAARKSPWRWAALAFVLTIPVALNVHPSLEWTMVLKSIPFIRSTATIFRWVVIYVPVIVVAASLAFDRLPWRTQSASRVAAISCSAIAIAFSVTAARDVYNGFPYDTSTIVGAWRSMHEASEIVPVHLVYAPVDATGQLVRLHQGDDILVNGGTNVSCYEPLFGYQTEKLPWQGMHTGPALERTGDWLNVMEPACELFPKENSCEPGSRFPATRSADASAFLSWQPYPFKQPIWQQIASAINAVAVLAIGAGIVIGLLMRARRISRSSQPAPATPTG